MSAKTTHRFRITALVLSAFAGIALLSAAWLCWPREVGGLHEAPIPVPLLEGDGVESEDMPATPSSDLPRGDAAPSQETASNAGIALGGALRSADYESPRVLEDIAAELLESYAEGEPCALVDACYLDLFGNVWASVVRGADWVELCFVSRVDAGSDGERCHVRVVHLPGGA